MKKELILPVGIPGSGKTYLMNQLYFKSHVILSLDDMRLAAGSIFNPKIEPMLKGIYDLVGRSFMIRGQNIVLDSTNVSYNITKNWINTAKKYDYDTTLILMLTDFDVCLKRQTKNVPEEKMRIFVNQFDELMDIIHTLEVDKIIEVSNGEMTEWD